MNSFLDASKSLVSLGDEYIKKHGINEFAQKAGELLGRFNLANSFDYQALVESSFGSEFPKEQTYSSFQFSDLPLTLARGEKCFLDLYFWRRRPTVVHNHHFVGAFQCLSGFNVDLMFEYSKLRDLGKFHCLGKLDLVETRELKTGDIVEIGFLDKFIHQNHHQADLTVNVCFRTPELPGSNISNYLYSGLRYEKDPSLLARVNRLQAFLGLESFDSSKLELNLDDALYFLIQTYHSNSQNTRFLALRTDLSAKVENDLGIKLDGLMLQHEAELGRLEESYE